MRRRGTPQRPARGHVGLSARRAGRDPSHRGGIRRSSLARSGHESLPDEIFAYALAEYLQTRSSRVQTVTLEDLSFGDGAPGRVFCLDEPGLLGRLDRIESP